MTLASRRRSTAIAAFALLALIAELVGRSATLRVDRALSVVEPLATTTTPYYPFLLAGVKVLGALAGAALVWRVARALAMATAAERLLGTIGHLRRAGRPRPRLRLSAKLWLASFAATSLWYLLQTDYERVSQGRWPLLAPWLHTYALPVFALLAILLAISWAAVGDWLADVESYANETLVRAHRFLRAATSAARPRRMDDRAPRRLFGLAFESRPPRSRPDPRRGFPAGCRVIRSEGEMESQVVTHVPLALSQQGIRARLIALLGPVTSLGGVLWALAQPYRITLLHPHGQNFWWLVLEPPLLVVAVGVFFTYVIARPLLADLEDSHATSR